MSLPIESKIREEQQYNARNPKAEILEAKLVSTSEDTYTIQVTLPIHRRHSRDASDLVK